MSRLSSPDTPPPDPLPAPSAPGRTRPGPLVATALVTVLAVSAAFGWAWHRQEEAHEERYRALAARMQAATEEMDNQSASMRELLAEYAALQEQHAETGTNLAAALAKVEELKARLDAIESADWEGRYNEEAELRSRLEARAAELEQELADAGAVRTQLSDAVALARKREKQLAAAGEEIKKLKRQLATITSGRVRAPDSGSGYRESRISSLRAAIAGRPSAERRSILETVIPSIPDGIATSELLGMIEGMDSTDVRALLEAVHAHVSMGDGNDRASLLSAMAPDDAAAVAPLFDAGKK